MPNTRAPPSLRPAKVAACHVLAQLCQSNHSNQEAVADEGGLEAVSELLRPLVMSPAQDVEGEQEEQEAQRAQGASNNSSDNHISSNGSARLSSSNAAIVEAAVAASRRRVSGAGGAHGGGAYANGGTSGRAGSSSTSSSSGGGVGEDEDPLARARAFPGVLDAALRLLGALLEFNATNQRLVRCAAGVRWRRGQGWWRAGLAP